MTELIITGGKPLHGTVQVSGAKNAALPMMAAAILADGAVQLHNVPRLTNVRTMARLLVHLGVDVAHRGDRLTLATVDRSVVQARYDMVRRMRASFCVLGPLLARRGKAVVPLPGGCDIGDRPVDLHLRGLTALGAELRLENGCIVATARRLRGAEVDLMGQHGPTVTGTANVLSAAVLARGRTIITSAAREPEIVDLGNMLTAMGGADRRAGHFATGNRGRRATRRLPLALIPDRIQAATFLLAAAITGGEVTVTGAVPEHMTAILAALEESGAVVEVDADRVTVQAASRVRPVNVSAEPYPGLPTDLQAHWTAYMATALGPNHIEDRVFPMRWGHVAELRRLGADIQCQPGEVRIAGHTRYHGAEVVATDLRASAALILAALAARGTSIIHAAHHLERGYERLDRKLTRLGARIETQRSYPALQIPGKSFSPTR